MGTTPRRPGSRSSAWSLTFHLRDVLGTETVMALLWLRERVIPVSYANGAIQTALKQRSERSF